MAATLAALSRSFRRRDSHGTEFLSHARQAGGSAPYGGAVTPVDATAARDFLEALIAGAAVLGGAMAYCSGYGAAQARAQGLPADLLAHCINEGLADGFTWGWPVALSALMIMVWT